MFSVECLPQESSRFVYLSCRTSLLESSERRHSMVRWRLFAALMLLAVTLSERRANSDEVEPFSGTASSTETVSTSEYYCKHGLWLVPATMNNQPAVAVFGTGSNVVAVHAPNGPNSFPNVGVHIPPSIANPVTIFAEMPFSMAAQMGV